MDKTESEFRFARHKFPDALCQIHSGELDPFDFELNDPCYIFSQGAPAVSETLLPLFESGPFTYFYDEGDGSYLAFHLESPDDVHYFGKSVQCLWAAIFLNLFDDETTLPQIQATSQRVGFLFADFLFAKMREHVAGEISRDEAREEILQHCEGN